MTPHSHTDDRPRMAQRTDWRIARRGLRRDQPFFSFIHSSFTIFAIRAPVFWPKSRAPKMQKRSLYLPILRDGDLDGDN